MPPRQDTPTARRLEGRLTTSTTLCTAMRMDMVLVLVLVMVMAMETPSVLGTRVPPTAIQSCRQTNWW